MTTASTIDIAALRQLLDDISRTENAVTRESPLPETVRVTMRDGIHLATDIYRPVQAVAPVVVHRTPYDRTSERVRRTCGELAARGYVAIAQDCRGTGDSEPDHWDYYVREPEDGFDTISWILAQPWCDGFVGACGSSYSAQVQWCMATHPGMGAIIPEVSGLGFACPTTRLHMFLDAYARSVGKGAEKLDIGYDELERQMRDETLATGLFCEPFDPPLPAALLSRYPELRSLDNAAARRELWSIYADASCADRAALIKVATGSEAITIVEMEALPAIFGQNVAHDAHSLPAAGEKALMEAIHAPALMVTGWYDWGLVDALATFGAVQRYQHLAPMRDSRLIITPSAHNMPGYHEGADQQPALRRTFRTSEIVPLIDAWCRAASADALSQWPRVIYYLMGADEWRHAEAWPPGRGHAEPLYLREEGVLGLDPPGETLAADDYVYQPEAPTPTLGGSIVSYVSPPGSIDIAELHDRGDVLVYTSAVLSRDLDVVGPLRAVIHASSSAIDTDFAVRLSDVHPDGRVIQIQNGVLRARYRDGPDRPEPLKPGRAYRFEIDMWATAMRFAAGHRLRVDIASADFPRFDRHANRADPGPPLDAEQRVFRDIARPSHIMLSVTAGSLRDALGQGGGDGASGSTANGVK
ncbi:CocE/NonD family hydrolase [Rhizorhabdus dicambivorans]|uniref:Xaa-Pro dipeptidyl-peptidase C-terminal domain-containing protein n=1 Tax=Rhizorhabdus dicambivorans TaxID=1850238 RepID=A0A2A4FUK8_9SPHN|nr:CocE/NonD family hydrolase [Rhizorhabdus dicambivorans]PCE41128.1 hypothetical protein COO09_16630 [Rhizorhabdus dicambivorans]